MQAGLLPLFPLPLVLLPGMSLPLHIFEERYREMIGDVLREEAEFGIVLARSNGILNAGCTAAVEKVLKKYPDGQMDILAMGRRRFEVVSLNDEKAYLRAEVEFFDDEGGEPASDDLLRRAQEACRPLWEMEGSDAPAVSPDEPQSSFLLAQAIEDVDFRQTLLRLRSETERLKELAAFCVQYVPRQRMVAQLKKVQPRNGHSRLGLPMAGHS